MVGSIYGSTENFDYTEVKEKSSDDGSIVLMRFFIYDDQHQLKTNDVLKFVEELKEINTDFKEYIARIVLPILEDDNKDASQVFDVQLVQRRK